MVVWTVHTLHPLFLHQSVGHIYFDAFFVASSSNNVDDDYYEQRWALEHFCVDSEQPK